MSDPLLRSGRINWHFVGVYKLRKATHDSNSGQTGFPSISVSIWSCGGPRCLPSMDLHHKQSTVCPGIGILLVWRILHVQLALRPHSILKRNLNPSLCDDSGVLLHTVVYNSLQDCCNAGSFVMVAQFNLQIFRVHAWTGGRLAILVSLLLHFAFFFWVDFLPLVFCFWRPVGATSPSLRVSFCVGAIHFFMAVSRLNVTLGSWWVCSCFPHGALIFFYTGRDWQKRVFCCFLENVWMFDTHAHLFTWSHFSLNGLVLDFCCFYFLTFKYVFAPSLYHGNLWSIWPVFLCALHRTTSTILYFYYQHTRVKICLKLSLSCVLSSIVSIWAYVNCCWESCIGKFKNMFAGNLMFVFIHVIVYLHKFYKK